MYKKVLEKLANAGTLAILGYEIGTHSTGEEQHKIEKQVESSNHNIEIILLCLIIVFIILIAIMMKVILKKRALVWISEKRYEIHAK